jgi:nucleolar protein 9
MMTDHSDYQRPRRPNPDTVAYLKSLPLSVGVAKDQITSFLSNRASADGNEFPPLLTAALSALDEVRHEVASLAGDEDASQILETIAHISLPYSETAARIMMGALVGYHLHLATHRYGSHVVQTILQVGLRSNCRQDLALDEEAPQITTDNLASLSDLVLGMVEELTPSAPQLAIHVCGSHVLRSLVCVLGGVQIKANQQQQLENMRRGREKKNKKKKKKPAEEDSSQRHISTMELDYHQYDDKSRLPDMADTFELLLQSIWGSDKQGELQQMTCHPSAGPLLIVSLRVQTFVHCPDKPKWIERKDEISDKDYFRLGVFRPQPQFELDSPTHTLAKRILHLDSHDTSDVIYGMSGEPRASHVLETLIRISPDPVFADILNKGLFVTSLVDYVRHDVSNFVVQALFSTVRKKEQAEALLKSVEKLISNGYVVNPVNKRVGILWRATELAAKYHIQQESLLKALRIGIGIVTRVQEEGDPDDSQEATTEACREKKKKQRQKAMSISLKECVAPLLSLKAPERDGDRVTLGVEGTRAVHYLLRFSPRLCGDILDGLTDHLTQHELELLARDGLGSRCVWDGILDGPRDEAAFSKAARKLVAKLSGRWVALACDRVGHHSVIKLFSFLELRDKATLAAELAQGSNRLGGSAMGRTVMEACAIQQFLGGEKEWTQAIQKMFNDESFLNDILEVPQEETTGNKRKRRRKKKQDASHKADYSRKVKRTMVDKIVDTLSQAVAS